MLDASAAEAVKRARLQLMLGEPYLATAVTRYRISQTNSPNSVTTMATDGFLIVYNADFVNRRSGEDLSFILAHEVLHCVLGHIDRRGEREPGRWNVAIDLAVNSALGSMGFSVPRYALLAGWTRGMTAEGIFERLPKDGSPDPGVRGDLGMDSHLAPGVSASLASEATESMPSPLERRRLRKQLLREMLNSGELAGTARGMLAGEIELASEPQVDWRAKLAHFFTGLRRDDYRLFPFNRRHIWREIYLPSVGVPAPSWVVVALDTSGSMSEDALSRIVVELDRLRAVTLCRMTLIQFDAAIQSVQEFSSSEEGGGVTVTEGGRLTIRGRGGTDICLPFQWIQEQLEEGESPPDSMIVATDGYGPMPSDPPRFPMLWLVPRHGVERFPYGDAVKLA